MSFCLLYVKGQGLNFGMEGLSRIKDVRADDIRHVLEQYSELAELSLRPGSGCRVQISLLL